MVELLNKIDNLQWYCDSCIPHSLNTVVSKFTVGANYFDEIKSLLNSFISLTNPPVQFNLASTPNSSEISMDQIVINAQPNDTPISTQPISNDVTTAQTANVIASQEEMEMEIDIQANRNKRARSLSPESSTNVTILRNISSAPALNSSPLENLVLGANSDSTEKVSLDELEFFEKLITVKLTELIGHRIIPQQHGFMKHRSTANNLMEFIHFVIKTRAKSMSCTQISEKRLTRLTIAFYYQNSTNSASHKTLFIG